MSSPVPAIAADAFFTSLRDRSADGISTIEVEGGRLPVLVRLQDSSTVVFSFAGAINRTRHALPAFTSTHLYRHVPASVVGIADPSLARSDNLKLAWYAGDEDFAVQTQLTEAIRRMIDSLEATRIVFVGGSGGGFAALYYSWQLPGSVAIVSNPQTNLNHAISRHRELYRAACWPSLSPDTPMSQAIDVDLCALYASRCDSSVIYLQEATDFFHLKWHFGPFVTGLPREYADCLITRMTSWGRRGHQAVPATVWISWLNAALTAPATSAASIEQTWIEQNPIELPHLDQLPSPPQIPRSANRDEQIAARLARSAAGSLLVASPSSERISK